MLSGVCVIVDILLFPCGRWHLGIANSLNALVEGETAKFGDRTGSWTVLYESIFVRLLQSISQPNGRSRVKSLILRYASIFSWSIATRKFNQVVRLSSVETWHDLVNISKQKANRVMSDREINQFEWVTTMWEVCCVKAEAGRPGDTPFVHCMLSRIDLLMIFTSITLPFSLIQCYAVCWPGATWSSCWWKEYNSPRSEFKLTTLARGPDACGLEIDNRL